MHVRQKLIEIVPGVILSILLAGVIGGGMTIEAGDDRRMVLIGGIGVWCLAGFVLIAYRQARLEDQTSAWVWLKNERKRQIVFACFVVYACFSAVLLAAGLTNTSH